LQGLFITAGVQLNHNKGVYMADEDDNKVEQKKSGAYGKRSKAQWIVIYVIAAVIVYGLIYLIFFHKSGGGSGYGY
jgi:hypothetical protein